MGGRVICLNVRSKTIVYSPNPYFLHNSWGENLWKKERKNSEKILKNREVSGERERKDSEKKEKNKTVEKKQQSEKKN